ncbi:MAG: type II secretion system protein [Gammaproteobacteria bacterium]|nr:type II secretion system protein [Gammaproteobacteria bacterium]
MLRRHRGFTLIELVISVAIIGLLASAALPLASMTIKRAKETELRAALREIRTAIDLYKDAAAHGRVRVDADATGYPPDLKSLYAGVEDLSSADKRLIYFLRRLPRDPMFPDGTASADDSWGLRSYASPPDAPQPGADVYDVYSLSNDKGLNGVPYREW